MVKKAFIVISLLLLATYSAFAGKASKYTISIEGGSTTEYSYTDWPALMTQVKTYTGTDAARVTVTITGNDFDANDNMPQKSNVNTILCADDNVPYTTFKFVDCTFQKGDQYDCISFGYATVKGVVLEFHDCTLEERLYGNEAGTAEGTHYNIDVKFYGCTFTSASTGGRYFGDLLFDGCEFTNLVSWDNTEALINAVNSTAVSTSRRQNSVGDESQFTLKNCTFAQPITDATWLRYIYAPDFENYDIELSQYFYPCLSDTYVIEDIAKYNADKLGTGKVKTLKIKNNDISSSKNVILLFWPARVKYVANAPESATVGGETKDDNMYEPGQNFTVKTNGFTCAGYRFTGWNTLANPTDTAPGTPFTEGQVAQMPLTIGYKLYAQWSKPTGTGPFLVVEKAAKYPTLQQAVDAAASGNTIKVLPCSEFSETKYGRDYARSSNPANTTFDGRVVLINKSLTIKGQYSGAGPDHTDPSTYNSELFDFAIMVSGTSDGVDFTLQDIKLTGSSILFFDNTTSDKKFASIHVDNCYANIANATHGQKINNVGFGSTYSGGNFIQFSQQSASGKVSSLIAENNTVISKSTDANQPSNRYINGAGRYKQLIIRNNVFGSSELPLTGMAFEIERALSGEDVTYDIFGNTYYVAYSSSTTPAYIHSDTGSVPSSLIVNIHDNNVIESSGKRWPATEGTPWSLGIFTANGGLPTGKVNVYRNYVNGYCNNYMEVKGSTIVQNFQPGHAWDEHIKDVPSGSSKNPDIYYNNKAFEYNEATGEFIEHDLGSTQYCDRCDEVHINPGITITAAGLAKGESAVFNVIRTVSDVETLLLQVMIIGEEGGGGSRTVKGLEAGNYKVTPASWGWTYDIDPASKSVTLDGANPVEVEFTLSKKSGTLPSNAENTRANKYK